MLLNGLKIIKHITSYYLGLNTYVNTIKNVCMNLAQINIFYIKFFQWFTTTISECDLDAEKQLVPFFAKYKDNVDYTVEDIDYDALLTLERMVKKEGIGLIIENGYRPINSGTIALVFKARLDGVPVVIKLKRKHTLERLTTLFDHLRWLNYIPGLTFNVTQVINDVKDTFLAQTDFLKEVNNAVLFGEKFKKNQTIIIPKVYKKYTLENPNLIVMTYLEKTRDDLTDNDKRIYCDIFTKFVMASYFIKDVYHGDLHMGNLFFMKASKAPEIGSAAGEGAEAVEAVEAVEGGHQLGILDFGVVGTLSVDGQNFIFNLLNCFRKNNFEAVIDCYVSYMMHINKSKDETLKKKIIDHIANLFIKHKCTDFTHLNHLQIKLMSTVSTFGFPIDKDLNIYILSLLTMTDTMKAISSNTTNENFLVTLFDKIGIE